MPVLFEGLYLGEVVLLVLGIVLFVVLVIGFLYQLLHKRSTAPLLPYFLLPIAMIGYPSIKNIQYKDGLVTLNTTFDQLEQNPTDPALRQNLQQQVNKIGSRPMTPQNTVLVAKAQYALGDEDAAKSNLQKALQANPNEPAARQLETKIATIENLKQLATQVEADPGNQAAKAKLASTLAQTSQLKLTNPAALIQVARAQTALGDHAQALENTQKVLAINPNSAAALQLRTAIKARAGMQ